MVDMVMSSTITNSPNTPTPAAQYLRMSTEHQKYSLDNQVAANKEYAERNGFNVIKSYVDAGKSGLALKHREGLAQLLHDVTAAQQPYRAILVYDVSRWGRFQDTDEAAYYEFLCKRAGVPIYYCAETFANDGSMPSAIFKSLKRMMAGEYSRELSDKVYEGSKRIAQRGFRTGGTEGYGFRRMLVSPVGEMKQELRFGERKSIQEDRVVLVLGPADEVRCVREIFRMLIEEHKMSTAIASELNRAGICYNGIKRKHWYPGAVDRILKNPKYAGIGVYGRSTQKLGTRVRFLPRSTWTTVPGSWKPIIDHETFRTAERVLQSQTANKTDDDLLDELRTVFAQHNRLTQRLVRAALPNRSSGTYARRFESLSEAFARAGYFGAKLKATKTRRTLCSLRRDLLDEITRLHQGEVVIFRENHRATPRLRLRNGQLVAVHVCQSHRIKSGELRWRLNLPRGERDCSIILLARLDTNNNGFVDFHVLPTLPHPTTWTVQPDDPWFKQGGLACALADFVTAVRDVEKQQVGRDH
jgi:DNA invertase Pin-like site-specific DNA recombinase